MGDELALEDQLKELKTEVAKLTKQLSQAKIRFDSPSKDLPCFDQYRLADGRIITSSVIKQTDQWYESSLLIPHEMLRHSLLEINYILSTGQIKPDEPWKLVNFFHWYKVRFVRIVHEHHDAEEKIFFPVLKKRVTIPDKTAADHKTLMKLLDDISQIAKDFKADGGSDTNYAAAIKTIPLLTKKWDDLVTMMLPHLAEEEEQMITIIKDAFKKEEIDALVDKIIKSQGLSAGRLNVPAIFR
jgi:hypothetical protein